MDELCRTVFVVAQPLAGETINRRIRQNQMYSNFVK